MQVLIVKISSMGDILHTFPSLTDAKRAIPSIRFDWVVEEEFIQIPTWHKSVNQVIPISIRSWRNSWFSKMVRIKRKEFKKTLRKKHYDLIIDAQGLIKSAVLVTRLAYGVKHGMDWKTSREAIASFFYNFNHYIDKKKHAVERTRELFAKSLGYLKPQTYGSYDISKNFLNKQDRMPYFIFLHSTTCYSKHWPETHWRKLIELMQSDKFYIKLPWKVKEERCRAERLAFGFTNVKILPKLSLEKIAEEIKGAKATVSVDTGLSNLSAALDKVNLTLFGPTNPDLIGGYGKNQHKIISYSKQIKDITADEVFIYLKEKCKVL